MNMLLASMNNTISNQLVSVSDLMNNFLWLGIFIFIVGGVVRICLSQSAQHDVKEEIKGDETKKLNLLDNFPVDDSVKVETRQASAQQTAKSNISLGKASSNIDLDKPPSL